MNSEYVPKPRVMPINREEWRRQLHLSNFVNTYYQYRDIQLCDEARSLLVVGPGQGLDTQVFRWRGYEVTTFDIDTVFAPDYVGSVHDLGIFRNGQFDVVIASHVLEHLAVPYLDSCLREIARVGRYAILYFPIAGRHLHLRFLGDIKGIDVSLVVDVFNYFKKPDGVTPRFAQGQHFWELGMRGFRVRDLVRRVSQYFEIVSVYRNRDWHCSHNFVLKSRGVT